MITNGELRLGQRPNRMRFSLNVTDLRHDMRRPFYEMSVRFPMPQQRQRPTLGLGGGGYLTAMIGNDVALQTLTFKLELLAKILARAKTL